MQCNVEVELDLRWRKLLKVLAFKIFVTSRMVLFEIHQRFKGHFFKKLHVSFNSLCNIKQKTMSPRKSEEDVMIMFYSFVQKQPLEVFYKKGVLKNFRSFTGKLQCWSLLKTPFFWRKTPFLKKNTFFEEHLQMVVSVCT